MLSDTKVNKVEVGGIYESFLDGATEKNLVLFLILSPARHAVDESGNDENWDLIRLRLTRKGAGSTGVWVFKHVSPMGLIGVQERSKS